MGPEPPAHAGDRDPSGDEPVGEAATTLVQEPAPPGPDGGHQGAAPGRGGRRWAWIVGIAVLAVAALAVALIAVLAGDDDTDTATGGGSTVAPTTAPSGSPTGTSGTEAGGGATASTAPSATMMQLTVYLIDGDATHVVATPRTVPATDAVARAALSALLEGTAASDPAGTASVIPVGTRLLDVSVDDGIATVDLSSEFASGGGSASMSGRVAQVVYTLTEFDTVDAVLFHIEGQPVEALGGEGVPLAEPQTRADWADWAP